MSTEPPHDSERERLERFERSVAHDVIRKHRLRRGLSQEQVAEKMRTLGFSHVLQTTVGKIETGARPLRLAEFVGLAHALDMPWPSMLSEAEPMLDADDPIAEMERIVAVAQRHEDAAREAMDKATRAYADAYANRLAFAGELRRMTENARSTGTGGEPDGSAADPAR